MCADQLPRRMTSPHQIRSPSHEEPDHILDDPAAAYYEYHHSPMATHPRSGTAIPPTQSHSRTFPFASHLRNGPREWCEARSPTQGHPTAPSLLWARRTHIRSDIYVADRAMAAHKMALSTFRR